MLRVMSWSPLRPCLCLRSVVCSRSCTATWKSVEFARCCVRSFFSALDGFLDIVKGANIRTLHSRRFTMEVRPDFSEAPSSPLGITWNPTGGKYMTPYATCISYVYVPIFTNNEEYKMHAHMRPGARVYRGLKHE